jgi:hypothetical protein
MVRPETNRIAGQPAAHAPDGVPALPPRLFPEPV